MQHYYIHDKQRKTKQKTNSRVERNYLDGPIVWPNLLVILSACISGHIIRQGKHYITSLLKSGNTHTNTHPESILHSNQKKSFNQKISLCDILLKKE